MLIEVESVLFSDTQNVVPAAFCEACGGLTKNGVCLSCKREKAQQADHADLQTPYTGGYKKIEQGVVDGYKKIEQGVVKAYTKIEDKFVEAYLTKEGETVEEAKQRLKKEK